MLLTELGRLKNRTVTIKTSLPEGIPFEKTKWKSENGEKYKYISADYSLNGQTKLFGIYCELGVRSESRVFRFLIQFFTQILQKQR